LIARSPRVGLPAGARRLRAVPPARVGAGAVACLVATSGLGAQTAPASAAPTPPSGLLPEAVLELQIPEDPQVAPDGGRVAFVRRFVDHDGLEYSSIFVIPSDGGRLERLTDGPRTDRSPRFSPDGRRIAWIALTDGFWEIRVHDLTTGREHAIVPGSFPPGTIAWSPAGDRIAYTRLLPDPGGSGGAVHLFVVPASGGTPLRISGERVGRGDIVPDARLAWTAGGRAIVLSAAPDGDRDILEIDLAGGVDRSLSRRRGPDVDPDVSRRGDMIVFAGRDRDEADPRTRLYVVDRSGAGASRPVPADPEASAHHPVWAADGRGVYAILETAGARRLALLGLDGTDREVADRVDGWSFGVSTDSLAPRLATVSSRPGRPPEVFVWRPGFGRPSSPVTSLNHSLDPARLGRAVPIYDASEGSEVLLASALLPPGVDDLESLPAGGALLVDARADAPPPGSFDIARQVLAGAGVVVLAAPDRARGELAARRLVDRGRAAPGRVLLLTSDGDAVARDGVSPTPVEAPFAAGIDWGATGWDALLPMERVAKLAATLEWLRAMP